MAVGRARSFLTFVFTLFGLAVCTSAAPQALAQSSSVSAWDAADFRIWGYVPNWTSQTQINNFNTNGIYDHVSDVLYFGGVQPKIDGTLYYHSTANSHQRRRHRRRLECDLLQPDDAGDVRQQCEELSRRQQHEGVQPRLGAADHGDGVG